MKLLHLRNRWKSRVKKFRGSPQARRHSNQGSLKSPGAPIPKETNLQGDQSPRTPLPEETNYWVPAWLDGAPGHQCIGWEMQSATKLVPQSTFSNYSDRPCKARLWVLVWRRFCHIYKHDRPASNCGNHALMSFAINNFLLGQVLQSRFDTCLFECRGNSRGATHVKPSRMTERLMFAIDQLIEREGNGTNATR